MGGGVLERSESGLRVVIDNLQLALERIRQALQSGDLRTAVALAESERHRHPQDARTWEILSEVALAGGNLSGARAAIERAVALDPGRWTAKLQQGVLLALAGERHTALEVAAESVQLAGNEFGEHLKLGTLYSHCGEPTLARDSFRKALERKPDDPRTAYNLATALRMTGELAEAERLCDGVIAEQPLNVEAHALRSDLRVQTPDANHVAALSELAEQRMLDARPRARVYFSLAKELEDLGRDAESFSALRRGCSLQRSLMKYDVSEDIATLDEIRQQHTAANLAQMGPGLNVRGPIFVVGMPRTGTTLIEQILASHAYVTSVGERNDFAIALVTLANATSSRRLSRHELVSGCLSIKAASLGESYLRGIHPNGRFIDKMPLNSLYLGLIHRALPQAKLVLLTREPMDTIYAVYKSYFVGAYPFSYDLGELARYYIAWHRLMEHWRTLLGERLCVVSYESIIDDPEATCRRLFAYCDLEWDPRCLRFYESTKAATTLSAAQVRRPLYRSSIGKWRRHEHEFHEVAALFQQEGIRYH